MGLGGLAGGPQEGILFGEEGIEHGEASPFGGLVSASDQQVVVVDDRQVAEGGVVSHNEEDTDRLLAEVNPCFQVSQKYFYNIPTPWQIPNEALKGLSRKKGLP